MLIITICAMGVALLLNAGIFGFFYAWVCSTMWGLDVADPRVAIEAMQAMNASVRNMTFAPAFFGTPFALWLAAALLWRSQNIASARCFAVAGLTYFALGMLLTMGINVPMNEALAMVQVPATIEEARVIWDDYSGTWQVWNQVRTFTSGLAFAIALAGVFFFRVNRVA
ncbi:MAG: anthrone oxygenase family protein [Pseudomonadota bacterium]|nr:anthrone oxygenase family protein [Pseudomonadota bacterium]